MFESTEFELTIDLCDSLPTGSRTSISIFYMVFHQNMMEYFIKF